MKCSSCIKEGYEIDVQAEADLLTPGMVASPFNCEICGLYSIGKDTDGTVKIMRQVNGEFLPWETFGYQGGPQSTSRT
jgi:hypothetical protein